MKKLFTSLLLILSLISLNACKQEMVSENQEKTKVGVILPLSGNAAPVNS